ncbi:MAG: hypothetical protein NTX33_17180 [Propionibacteriales bacterium]|nr:hypothetical protein [Propionibacteriales bacterium]
MIVVWLAAAAAAGALAVHALALAADVVTPTWPEDEPLHVRDNRAHDLELTHLARLIGARDPSTIHERLVAMVDRLVTTTAVLAGPADVDPRAALPAAVRRFLDAPPLDSPDRYRRELAAVLDDLEAL